MKQLSSQDALFLFMEAPNVPNNVAVILVVSPGRGGARPNFKRFVEHVKGRLHLSPVYRRRLERVPLDLDYPYWVDDENFDVDNHLEYTFLPKPGTWPKFTRLVSTYQYEPLDMQRPLWEVLMVDGLDRIEGVPRGSFALILKSHHAAMDGVSSVQFFMSLCDIDATGSPALSKAHEVETSGVPSPTRRVLARAVASNVRSPVDLAVSVGRAATSLMPMAYRKLRGRENAESHGVPDTRFNRPLSNRKQFDACWFELSEFKRIKAGVTGATINDVVLAVCGGALRKYLQTHGELPVESLMACIAVNTRPRNGEAAGAGNSVSAMFVPLHTDLEKPYERLAAISQKTHRLKDGEPGVAAHLVEIGRHMPPVGMSLLMRFATRASARVRPCNVVISNVPGPRTPLYVAGAKCMHYLGVVPIADGFGLCIGTPSYCEEIAFNVMSTVEVIPDMEYFIQCLKDSVQDFRECGDAVGRRSGNRGRHPRKVSARRTKV